MYSKSIFNSREKKIVIFFFTSTNIIYLWRSTVGRFRVRRSKNNIYVKFRRATIWRQKNPNGENRLNYMTINVNSFVTVNYQHFSRQGAGDNLLLLLYRIRQWRGMINHTHHSVRYTPPNSNWSRCIENFSKYNSG